MVVLEERTNSILLDDDDDDYDIMDDDDDDDEEHEEHEEHFPTKVDRHLSSSLKPKAKPKKTSRRRRRSSARFLRLGEVDEENEENQPAAAVAASNEHLGEVYQKVIRMNAENRINASNSWNLSLIDHLDRFLLPSQQTASSLEDTLGPVTGVNFTKASCTLDASVKIYSYRVDDVHLTSYKVLANLNRTDTGKNQNNSKSKNTSGGADGDASKDSSERTEKRRAATETLESNLAHINMTKLDAAFDIDPLFHKMSMTFDEGGAKGLLLANLGVSSTGCNIVFDSTLVDEETKEESKESDEQASKPVSVDVTSLLAALGSSLNGQTVHQMSLVPQLATLRSEFAELKEDGFVKKFKPSKKYAVPQAEEIEADRSIHYEAIERSRASQADLGRSIMAQDDDDDDDTSAGGGGGYAPDDFGGGDDDDDDEDGFVGSSFNMHDGDHRFSSESFQTVFASSQPPSQASILLDAMASGDISGSQSNYEYFNSQALENIQGNMWAGAAHWKKGRPRRKPKMGKDMGNDTETGKATPAAKKRKGRTAKAKSNSFIIDLTKPVENLDDLLRMPPKSKRGTDPLQLTKAAKSKHSKTENLLPLDAGMGVNQLTSLFLRPNTNVNEMAAAATATSKPTKAVGFGGVETWADDGSFGGGDDDGGFGYNFGGDDNDNNLGEFVVPELEGVRKVQKVNVGYATVAKKVDVKRLKRDLWTELERTFQQEEDGGEVEEAKEEMEEKDAEDDDTEIEEPDVHTTPKNTIEEPLSFQNTVREMQISQTQGDVTLPFYFICVLHLANEKGLALESTGLEDFVIRSS